MDIAIGSDDLTVSNWSGGDVHILRGFSCKGAMVTQMPYNNPRVLEEHNHPPNNAEFEVTLLRLKMRDLAATSTGTLNSLVRMVLREASQEARNLLEPILDGNQTRPASTATKADIRYLKTMTYLPAATIVGPYHEDEAVVGRNSSVR
ncbi:uncharacterized protein LOC124355952 [Homalodisca vitripennis]|uniref:uncharacterized protein LOC124355952 n=1 Tax=Homalodisca vitripennis TaxID=197043 RepID=UPI001EECED71|nr:uncharacterized protein LOC124355952 [Homalodisca vitripennis]